MPSIVRSTPLSCTSFSFPMLSLAQALQVIAILDLDGVDLCIASGARDVRAEAVISDATGLGRKHRQICQDFGLEVYDVFAHIGSSVSDRPINIADPSTIVENRVILSHYFEYAQAAGSPGVTISPGLLDPLDAHRAFMRATSELSWACEQARSFGIELSIEPHLGSIAHDVASTKRLCGAVDGLSLTLDHSHFIASCVPPETVNPLFAFARHAHLRQARPGFLQCRVKDGALNVSSTLQAATAYGFTGTFALEFIHSEAWGMDQLDVLSETVRLRDVVRRPPP